VTSGPRECRSLSKSSDGCTDSRENGPRSRAPLPLTLGPVHRVELFLELSVDSCRHSGTARLSNGAPAKPSFRRPLTTRGKTDQD